MAFIIFLNAMGAAKSGSLAGEAATAPRPRVHPVVLLDLGMYHVLPIGTHTYTHVYSTYTHASFGAQINIQKHWCKHRWRVLPNPVPLMAPSS